MNQVTHHNATPAEPTDEVIIEAASILWLENPCEADSSEYRLWQKGWTKAAMGFQVSLSNSLPAFWEGYQAGQQWRTDWISYQRKE